MSSNAKPKTRLSALKKGGSWSTSLRPTTTSPFSSRFCLFSGVAPALSLAVPATATRTPCTHWCIHLLIRTVIAALTDTPALMLCVCWCGCEGVSHFVCSHHWVRLIRRGRHHSLSHVFSVLPRPCVRVCVTNTHIHSRTRARLYTEKERKKQHDARLYACTRALALVASMPLPHPRWSRKHESLVPCGYVR